MNDKHQILAALQQVFDRWQELLAGLSEAQIAEPQLAGTWSIKDTVAHLWSWQQATVARAEAALHGREPAYPEWWERFDPDMEKDVDRTNAWFFQSNHARPWPSVYADWKTQFRRCLELAGEIPEQAMLEPARYPWMGGYALSASFLGTVEHHQEHMDALFAWLREHGT
jgi:hypothetical protein